MPCYACTPSCAQHGRLHNCRTQLFPAAVRDPPDTTAHTPKVRFYSVILGALLQHQLYLALSIPLLRLHTSAAASGGAKVDIQHAPWRDLAGLLGVADLRLDGPWQSCTHCTREQVIAMAEYGRGCRGLESKTPPNPPSSSAYEWLAWDAASCFMCCCTRRLQVCCSHQ